MSTRNDDERQAVAHWLDRNYGPSVRASEWLGGGPNGGHDWLAAADDVMEVARKNRQGSHNPAQGGRTGAQGTPGGPEVSQDADGASVRSLGDRLRAAADYQDRPGAYDELRAMADEADRLQNERDAIDESLWRFKESFHEVLGGKPLAEWHAENCGAVEGAEQMRRDRDQARGDLAAQEGIAQELRGQINGLIQEKDQWHDSAKVAEATVGRALVLAAEWASSPAVGGSSSEQWEFDTLRTAARDLYEALDGGTEADRG